MKIIAVDDEQLMLEKLVSSIHEAAPDAELAFFRRSSEALVFAANNPIDVAFLDIRMRGIDGLVLGKALLELNPELNLVYCSAYDEYVSAAFREVRCNGYITKPVTTQQVKKELEHLRVPLKQRRESSVSVRCKGRFEVFVNGEPMMFNSAKTKEFLAFLVNAKGQICSNHEILKNLWTDDANHESYFKKIRKDLLDTFERYGCSDVIVRQRGGLGIDKDKILYD